MTTELVKTVTRCDSPPPWTCFKDVDLNLLPCTKYSHLLSPFKEIAMLCDVGCIDEAIVHYVAETDHMLLDELHWLGHGERCYIELAPTLLLAHAIPRGVAERIVGLLRSEWLVLCPEPPFQAHDLQTLLGHRARIVPAVDIQLPKLIARRREPQGGYRQPRRLWATLRVGPGANINEIQNRIHHTEAGLEP